MFTLVCYVGSRKQVQSSLASAGLLSLLLCLSGHNSYAEVVLDGTLGPALTLTGPEFILPAAAGLQRGTHLFHSLHRLKLNPTQQLTLTGPSDIRNVIARITGPEPTLLNGTLRSTMPVANVFLLSPRGIVIGANAQLDLPADLHLSTADQLYFSDGSIFNADIDSTSLFSTAPPSHFGFLNAAPASVWIENAALTLSTQAQLSLIGGEITVQDSQINTPAGTLNIVSFADAGTLALNTLHSTAHHFGKVFIRGSALNSSGVQGGRLWLQGGATLINDSRLSTRAEGNDNPAGNAEIALPSGIHIRAQTLRLTQGSILDSSTLNAASSGQVSLHASEAITVSAQSRIANTVGDGFQTASGNGGNIQLSSPRLTLTEGSIIQTGAGAFLQPNSGHAGDIFIQVGALLLTDRSALITSTLSDGQGGDIVINAEQILLDNAAITASSSGIGNTGQVDIQAQQMEMRAISVISTRSSESGGGDVTLTLNTHLFLLNSAISATAFGTRPQDNGGNVRVQNPTFTVLDNSEIFASAFAGNGGNILLNADYLLARLSRLDASSTLGIDGEIRIESPIVDIDRSLTVLPERYADASQWINKRCADRLGDNLSSLAWLEYEVLPLSPYGLRSNAELIPTMPTSSTQGAKFLSCTQ